MRGARGVPDVLLFTAFHLRAVPVAFHRNRAARNLSTPRRFSRLACEAGTGVFEPASADTFASREEPRPFFVFAENSCERGGYVLL